MSFNVAPGTLILIVEDDTEIRQALAEMLEFDGFRVIAAIHGKDGLEKLRQNPQISLVLLDLRMPVMNGHEFLAQLKANPAWCSLPVIVMSAHADAGKLPGIREFIQKPIDMNRLISLITSASAVKSSA